MSHHQTRTVRRPCRKRCGRLTYSITGICWQCGRNAKCSACGQRNASGTGATCPPCREALRRKRAVRGVREAPMLTPGRAERIAQLAERLAKGLDLWTGEPR